ncbi:MAG: hypothetical protein ABI680_12420, partial [Chthoniobacteraceae bacterium]
MERWIFLAASAWLVITACNQLAARGNFEKGNVGLATVDFLAELLSIGAFAVLGYRILDYAAARHAPQRGT